MRILICDDDALIIEQLQKYIRNFFENISVKCPELVCFSDGESLLADTGDKDILFLDIEMPGMNGIYVGKELKKKNDKIIIFLMMQCGSMYSDIFQNLWLNNGFSVI